jgi:predicted ATPase/class 3 adenylate cyclase
MFTDIQGSTQLLHELGNDRYRAVQDEHAVILRQAIAEADGTEIRTEGDSFFVVFPSATAAVRAAVSAQRGLAEHEWSHNPVKVRMGLHTGEGVLGGDDYVGMDVNRAARIAAAGHGCQVLLSAATRAVVGQSLPEDVELRDLGEHRLKDISHPEHLHDLVITGLLAEFPPLRSLGLRPNNLPLQLTSFVGREREIEDVRTLLSETRLVTVTGPGGAGKTRLALQVGAVLLSNFRDGVFFADLSVVADPALVPSAIAVAMHLRESGGRSFFEAIEDYVREKEMLLIVDNFEHVVEAAPPLERLLSTGPALRVLVTSRVSLSLRGEQEYAIPPLQLPLGERHADLSRLRELEAVRLFTERARAVRPEFQLTEANARAVAEITAQLDGLPLAIELAASRTKLFSPEQMLGRLDDGFSILSSNVQTVPERQRTLRGAIGWSYDLLDDAERKLFARMSVFTGGCTFESAEAVCDPLELGLDPIDGITHLIDQSLLVRSETFDGEPRLSMLVTIQDFAREQLTTTGELDMMLARHGRHFLTLAREAGAHLTGPQERVWLDRCERDHPNFRAALSWAINAGETEAAQLAAAALWRFWQLRGHLEEAREWFEEILAMPSGQPLTAARAKALAAAGGIAWWQGDIEAAERYYAEALAIERERDDSAGLAEALYNYAHIAISSGDMSSSLPMLEESQDLLTQVGDEAAVARVIAAVAGGRGMVGDWDSFVAQMEDVVGIWRRLGDRFQLTDNLNTLATGYARAGRPGEAWSAGLEGLDIAMADEVPLSVSMSLLALANLASWNGRHEDSLRLAGASETIRNEIGGGPPLDFLEPLIGDPLGDARSRLSGEAADRAWDQGRKMTTEEAVAFARRLGQ